VTETKLESPTSVSAFDHLLPSLESTAKLLLPVGAILYAIGFLIANLYFQQYGISDPVLLKPRYVVVGLLWSVLMLFAWLLTEYLVASVEALLGLLRGSARSGAISKLLRSALGLGVCIFLAKSVASVLGLSRTLGWWQYCVLLLIIELNFLSSFNFVSPIRRHLLAGKVGKSGIVASLSWLGLVLSTITCYSIAVYPCFDQSFGGGKLRKVEFLLKTDYRMFGNFIGLPISKDGQLGPVLMVYEAADSYVLAKGQPWPPEPPQRVEAYRISKATIEVVKYVN